MNNNDFQGCCPITPIPQPPKLPRLVGPPGPPGPPAEVCCPCTNLLDNPGFNLSAVGGAPVDWISSNATVVASPNHSGRFVSDPTTPVIQAVGIIGLNNNLPLNFPGFVNQVVPVEEGCCFTLTFEADVRDGGILVASVSFPDATPAQPCQPLITRTDNSPILTNPILTNNIPHIVTVPNQPLSVFQHFTLVVCTPPGSTMACITFQNIGNPAPGGTAFLDNVVFQNTGRPCPSCTQNF